MCLEPFAFQRHEEYPLVLASNRDEYFFRPTALPAWWAEHPDIFAGRDFQAAGSWLGVNRAGKFSAITNFREPRGADEGWASRGNLVQNFYAYRLYRMIFSPDRREKLSLSWL